MVQLTDMKNLVNKRCGYNDVNQIIKQIILQKSLIRLWYKLKINYSVLLHCLTFYQISQH
ncbi:hypothetical protein T11_15546 [Trichinella zimbabwensis]|uniref:Uncharacterized protein n=2 Tax=Trichinella TaxID=6333 RepID=A0A0V1MZM6_9BILA|nr:hypothetical protein T11_15546 [Trichinella zimbabwensis]KRZ77223.1 hypothetical protein T10_8201 [Trichinella papuae]